MDGVGEFWRERLHQGFIGPVVLSLLTLVIPSARSVCSELHVR